ncbi:transposable element Tcb2 transposase [Trichonephila clavipes]|nr:transposable element Tcb2 transposase [Trichonephila clavipes]
MEAGWSARRVARQLGRSDCVVRRCWDLWIPRDVIYMKIRPRTPSTDQSSTRPPHRKNGMRTANCFIGRHPGTAEWKQVVFSGKSRFNLSSEGNRDYVWRPRGERLNPAFALQRHTAPTDGVMIWGALTYNTRSPLIYPWHHDSPATDNLIGTSAHAPQRPMVMYTEMGTVGPGPHGLLRHGV